ncbi:hypothetical protein KAR91_09365, partial [Candidatus Pacearchaeota archaeon]|nr:hypothetical protein [Candidatus Pacearchaeota archaeon]
SGMPWVSFAENQVKTLVYTSDVCQKTKNQYNNPQWIFDVIEVTPGGNIPSFHGITSVRLLGALKHFRPLTGKCIRVTQTGQGKQTKYIAKEIPLVEAKKLIAEGAGNARE